MDRLVLSDSVGADSAAHHRWPDRRARPAATTGCSSRACSGSCAPARRGATCRRCSATGTASSAASAAGAEGRLVAHLRGDVGRSGLRVPDRRLHHRPRPPARSGGEKGGSEDQAIGRSRGGLSTKIHMAVRGLGCPVRFTLTAGQRGDAPAGRAADRGPARRGGDGRHRLRRRPPAPGHRRKRRARGHPEQSLARPKHPLDKHLYAQRHLIECCFSRLKQFRRVATRFEKTARNYLAVVTLAAIVLWLR